MKKIIFILILFLSCYFIYKYTQDDKLYYVTIGDYLSKGINEYNIAGYGYSDFVRDYLKEKDKLKHYDNTFTNKDYRITDLLRIIEYHEEININNTNVSLDQLLKKADIVTISIGMNELNYKLTINNENIYSYMDEMLEDVETLLEHINKFNYKKVFVLGYYNIANENDDIYEYINYKLKKLTLEEGFEFVDTSKLLNNKEKYFTNYPNLSPNLEGYKEISTKIIEKIQNY